MPTTYVSRSSSPRNGFTDDMTRKARSMKREASLDARRRLAIDLSNEAIQANRQAMGIKGDYLSPSFQALIKHALR